MPIYKKIIEYIEECIKSGIYSKDSLLPTEQDFCNLFNTSRMTVRKAFDELSTRGWVYRIKGKGTFVSGPGARRDYTLRGFSQIMADKGIDFKTKVLRFEIMPAPKEAAEKLRITENSPVYILERARYIHEEAMAVEKVYLNAVLFPGFLTINFAKHSLYETLKTKYDISLTKVEQQISLADIQGTDAKILFNKPTAVALQVRGLSYDENSVPVEFEIGFYNGYRYAVDVIIK